MRAVESFLELRSSKYSTCDSFRNPSQERHAVNANRKSFRVHSRTVLLDPSFIPNLIFLNPSLHSEYSATTDDVMLFQLCVRL